MIDVVTDREVGSWETIKVCKEFEDVNPITVKLLDRDFKYIYTFIKKRESVMATEIFSRFPKMDVERILYDLRDMHLIFFRREAK